MAFGITPQHTQELTFENLSQEQILVVGLDTAKRLGWDIGLINESGFKAYTRISLSSWGEELTVRIENNRMTLRSASTGSQLVDWGRNKRNVELFLTNFKDNMAVLSAEEVSAKFQEIKTSFVPVEPTVNKPLTSHDRVRNVLSLFIPSEGFFVTPILIDLNILIFVVMVVSGVNIMLPDSESLINWGANFRPSTLNGQAWRLLTSCFLHIGIFHLLMNMYALAYIGMLLEPLLGKTRYLTAYLLAGIAGSAASLYWHEFTVSAGASGAIFGMYGVFLAMLTTNLIEKSARQSMLTSIGIFVVYNLAAGASGGIDTAGHIGGLVTGILIGYAYYPGLLKPDQQNIRHITVSILTVVIVLFCTLVYQRTPNYWAQYSEKMKEFVALEKDALEVYHKDGNTSDAQLLRAIRERGIDYWNRCIKIAQEADQLPLPETIHERNKLLIKYCKLRIESYQLLYRAIEENSDNYQKDIRYVNSRIDSIIKVMGSEN